MGLFFCAHKYVRMSKKLWRSKMNKISERIEGKLTPEQIEMRDNLTDGKRSRGYWERRWREDPESVCRDLENLYRTTGTEYQDLIVSTINEKFTHFEGVFIESNKKMLNMINDLRDRRREDRSLIDKHESEIATLKHASTNAALQVEQCLKISGMIYDGQKQTNENVDFIRDIITAKTESKSKTPWQLWAAIGFGIFLALALVTGNLGTVLEIVKGVKL